MKRDDPETTDNEIMEIEKNVEEVLDTICSQEAQKMETFRLLNDERASKAMINLEKKITGYSNMTGMNKPNPGYIEPDKKAQTNCLKDLKNELNMKRDDPETTEDEIMEFEKNVEEVLDTICSQAAHKMETFRLLNTERASNRVPKCQIICAGGFVLANFAQSFVNPICAIKTQKS